MGVVLIYLFESEWLRSAAAESGAQGLEFRVYGMLVPLICELCTKLHCPLCAGVESDSPVDELGRHLHGSSQAAVTAVRHAMLCPTSPKRTDIS